MVLQKMKIKKSKTTTKTDPQQRQNYSINSVLLGPVTSGKIYVDQ